MKDFVKGECNKLSRDYKDYVEKENNSTIKKVDILEGDLRKVRAAMGDQIDEL